MKNSSSLIGIFFIIFVSTFMLFTILIPDQNFSEQENRYLKQRPSFRLQSFFSGEFMEEFEEYIQDQFALKTKWLSLKTISEIFLFKQENNGVYFGKDGYLLEHFPSPSEQLQRNITSLNHFSLEDQKRKLYFLLAPTATEIYKEKLPPFAPTYSQKEVFSIVKEHLTSNYHWIDVFETLEKHKEDKIYFKTDHHWTMRGAFYAYEEAAEK